MRYFLYLERFDRMHEKKVFFFIFFIYFLQHFREIGYFNTGFVFLQYKNTNQY